MTGRLIGVPSDEEITRRFGLEPVVRCMDALPLRHELIEGQAVPLSEVGSEQREDAEHRLERLLRRVYVHDARAIRHTLAGGLQCDLAAELGVRQSSVSRLLSSARRRLQLAARLRDLTFDELVDQVDDVVGPAVRAAWPDHAARLVQVVAASYWIPSLSALSDGVGLPQHQVLAAASRWRKDAPSDHPWHVIDRAWPVPRGTSIRIPVWRGAEGGPGHQTAVFLRLDG